MMSLSDKWTTITALSRIQLLQFAVYVNLLSHTAVCEHSQDVGFTRCFKYALCNFDIATGKYFMAQYT